MIKVARKPSIDPAQEKLRQSKAAWNKDVSAFLNDVIHMKKLMNGWPSKYYKERSKIVMPIPANPGTVLSSLANEFQELAQRGDAIVQQQAQYSQNRRKPRPQQANETLNKLDEKYGPTSPEVAAPVAPATPGGADLSKQLSAWEKKYELVAEGTEHVETTEFMNLAADRVVSTARCDIPDDEPNKDSYFVHAVQSAAERLMNDEEAEYEGLPRAITPVELPGVVNAALIIGRVPRRLRDDDLLEASASNPFSRFLAKLKTPQIGFGADAQKRRLRMDMLKAALRSYRALSKMQVHVTKSSKQSIVDAYKAMQEAWNEWSVVSRNFNTIVNSMPDQPLRSEDMRDEPPPQGEDVDLGQKKNTPKPAVKPVSPTSPPLNQDTLPPTAPVVLPNLEKKKENEIEVVAQKFLKKWLGRTRHQLIPGRSSGLRLQAYEVADKARFSINTVMDLLEKGMSIEELGPKISEVSGHINTLRSLMRSLHNTEKPIKGQTSILDGIF